jgi:hypothetical protein
MSKFTVKTQFNFEPNVTAITLDGAPATVAHTTAQPWGPTLGDLAFIPYRRALARYKISTSALATVGSITFDVVAGGVVRGSKEIDLTAGANQSGQIPVDLATVAGETPVYVRVTINESADSGVTMQLDAALDIEVPLIVSGC